MYYREFPELFIYYIANVIVKYQACLILIAFLEKEQIDSHAIFGYVGLLCDIKTPSILISKYVTFYLKWLLKAM